MAQQVGLTEKGNARGVALVDLDNDGDLDMLVTRQFAPPSLYRNRSSEGNWVGLQLTGNGESCNRNAVGTRVTLSSGGERRQLREVQASNGFSAQGDARLLFGLGHYSGAPSVEIQWCGRGAPQTLALEPSRYHSISQPPD